MFPHRDAFKPIRSTSMSERERSSGSRRLYAEDELKTYKPMVADAVKWGNILSTRADLLAQDKHSCHGDRDCQQNPSQKQSPAGALRCVRQRPARRCGIRVEDGF